MKEGIHPKYVETRIVCGCGNSFTTRSTNRKPELKVDICNACHPFYTGKLKYVDTAGRIERFRSKFAGAGYASVERAKKKPAATEPAATEPAATEPAATEPAATEPAATAEPAESEEA